VVLEENREDKMDRECKENPIGLVIRIPRRICFRHYAHQGQMSEFEGAGRTRTQLLDDLRNRRKYWELKEEVEDVKR
jgi:hypothetical protein